MKKNIFLIALLSAFLVACGQADTPTSSKAQSTPAAERVLAAYRVRGMLEQSGPIIADALSANLPAAVSKQQRDQLLEVIDEAYAPGKLLEQVAQNLAQAAKSENQGEYLAEAAKALESDLAQRMVTLDEAAATDEFADAFAEFLEEPVTDGSDERMQSMQALADDLNLVELQIVFNVGMLRGMIEARNAASPEDYSMSQKSADTMITQTREGLQGHLNEQIPVMLFFAYREVEEGKIADYTKLQNSEAVRWTNGAMVKALGRAFEEAAKSVPKRYNELTANAST